MLISKTAKIKWNSRNKKRYIELGYKFTKMGDEFEVDVKHLSKGSHSIVRWKCDGECDEIITGEYCDYLKYVKEDGKIYCQTCAVKLFAGNTQIKTRLKNNGKSFEQLCIELNRLDILARWDEEKNGCKPNEVSYKSSKKRWFKCDKYPDIHSSELKLLSSFSSGEFGTMDCKQCNSIMQFCIDNNRLDELDIEKNEAEGLDLWSISYGSQTEVWFKCVKKDYHGSYKRKCCEFIDSKVCPCCGGKEVHPLDSLGQEIINEYGEEFLWKLWSDKNTISPFEISSGSDKKVWWNCLDENKNHKPYLRGCYDSKRSKYRCPECYEVPKGEDHPCWNPELTYEDRIERRLVDGYLDFVKEVMKRDYYRCQITGKKGKIVVHHIDGYNWCKEKRTDIDNGITLCEEIHKLFHSIYGCGNNTAEQFEEFLMNIEYGNIDISDIK